MLLRSSFFVLHSKFCCAVLGDILRLILRSKNTRYSAMSLLPIKDILRIFWDTAERCGGVINSKFTIHNSQLGWRLVIQNSQFAARCFFVLPSSLSFLHSPFFTLLSSLSFLHFSFFIHLKIPSYSKGRSLNLEKVNYVNKYPSQIRLFKNKFALVWNTQKLRKLVNGWQSDSFQKSPLFPHFATCDWVSNDVTTRL